jgi:hypothetical protein
VASMTTVEVRAQDSFSFTMTPRGFIADQGAGTLLIFGRAMTRPAYRRRMSWLMPRLLRVAPCIGNVLVSARKPGISVMEAS